MSNTSNMNPDEPLSPEAERVKRKVSRYGAVIMGFNLFAFLFLIGVIVYKLLGMGSSDDPVISSTASNYDEFNQSLDLPDDVQIISASQNGSQILLNLRYANGNAAIWIYDLTAKKITGKLTIN